MANVIFLRKGDQHTYPVPRVQLKVGAVNVMKLESLNNTKVSRLFKQQEENKK